MATEAGSASGFGVLSGAPSFQSASSASGGTAEGAISGSFVVGSGGAGGTGNESLLPKDINQNLLLAGTFVIISVVWLLSKR